MEPIRKVIVLSCGNDSNSAGEELTKQYTEWLKVNPKCSVIEARPTSHQYGWMLAITYEEIFDVPLPF